MVTHSWHIDLASVKAFEWLLSLSPLFTILLFTRAKRELYSLYSAKMHKILTISSFGVERKEMFWRAWSAREHGPTIFIN